MSSLQLHKKLKSTSAQEAKSLNGSITLNSFNSESLQGLQIGLWFGHPRSSKSLERRRRYSAVMERVWRPAGRADESIPFATLQPNELLSDVQICTVCVHASLISFPHVSVEWLMKSDKHICRAHICCLKNCFWKQKQEENNVGDVHRWDGWFSTHSKRFCFFLDIINVIKTVHIYGQRPQLINITAVREQKCCVTGW